MCLLTVALLLQKLSRLADCYVAICDYLWHWHLGVVYIICNNGDDIKIVFSLSFYVFVPNLYKFGIKAHPNGLSVEMIGSVCCLCVF